MIQIGMTESNDGREDDDGEEQEFAMTAKKWEFSPSTMTVNKGDAVKLRIESIDVTSCVALSFIHQQVLHLYHIYNLFS